MVAKTREQRILEAAERVKQESGGDGQFATDVLRGATPSQAGGVDLGLYSPGAAPVAPSGGIIPWGRLHPVMCDLYPPDPEHGYPGLTVYYRTNNYLRAVQERREGDDDATHVARLISRIAPTFSGWAFVDPYSGEPIPQPDPSDLDTYRVMVGEDSLLNDLGLWVINNYIVAVRASLGNSSGTSSASSSKKPPTRRKSSARS